MTNYSTFLSVLGFNKDTSDRWQRHFDFPASGECVITVDTAKRAIDYPKPITLGDRTTSNFDHPENFVVLECVCRLLAKGYDPATLILEKRYQLGRGASGGKSDITVLRRIADPTEQTNAPPLLIIECKTFGTEHDKEKQKTIEEGGQLFGYLQQDRSATHLCIYSSRLHEGNIEYRADIICVKDSHEAQEKFAKREKNDSHSAARQAVPLFEHAHNRETLHHAWKTTYGGVFQSIGIFEEEYTPYAIGYTPLRGKDLKEFNGQNGSTKVFNNFMEILRHNNVSDKENAFNRLCAIILAKLIDEDREPGAILDFQWFPNKDTDEDLIDRLQRLYKRGMKETLGEEITYFEERDIDNAFIAHRRDMARNQVKKIFRALKFYTNNDFAFKEVHNQKLFEQNTQVVREIVQLLQGYRLKYTSKQAFLGNLFELLLNSGFKQSEGQFFTPIPIARFIVRCLPLRERMQAAMERGEQFVIPRVMDYACGSAHFLTEVIEEIQQDLCTLGLPEAENTHWTRDHVWGIEKDYRLARTAKIALFLHGAGAANILHEDGLDHANPILPKPGTIDVLIANPPYSVKDFKQHLRLQNNQFTLLPHLTANSGEIETLFVERTAQLLAVGGVAGIILPSSILSNSGIYQRTRALLLENFLLRGIVELGGSAFIATGTNTIILLLERRPDSHREHFAIRAEALFDEDKKPNDTDYADSDLLRAYCVAAKLDFAAYLAWLAQASGELPEALQQASLFAAYQREFDELSETKRRKAQKNFTQLPFAEQQAELRGKYLRYCREEERTKFYYFALAHVETLAQGEIIPLSTITTVLRGIGNKTEEQAFLGYKWSQRRGAEGMVNLHEPYDGGLLYTPGGTSREEPLSKAAYHLRRAFLGDATEPPPKDSPLYGKLHTAPTSAYFDFSRTGCDLAVNLSPTEETAVPVFDTRYPLVPLGEIAEIRNGGTPSSKNAAYWDGGIAWATLVDVKQREVYQTVRTISKAGLDNSNAQLLPKNTVLLSSRATIGEVAIARIELATNQGFKNFICDKNRLLPEYLYEVLVWQKENIKALAGGMTYGEISKAKISHFAIPLPSLEVQQKIIQAIEALRKKAEKYVINDLEEQKRQILLDGIR
jgi:type I restriction enzyme M protein